MERLHYPIPLNPNAKYLPNSISNVLYSIQKFDQSTLAWPTCQRNTGVLIGKVFTSPPEVPLAGIESFVFQNRRQCASRGNAREVKKNTFYQILQASQDQPCVSQRSTIKRKSIDAKFKSVLKDDIIYNDIYDIVRSHTQYKGLPQLKKQPEQQKPFSVSPPVVEVYKVRPVATETKGGKGRSCKSTSLTNKLREKTNELSESKRTTHQSKPKLTEAKSSKKKPYKLQEKTNELSDSKRTTHPSKPKLREAKSSKKNAYKLQEKTNELSDSKKTTHPSKSKLTEKKGSKKKPYKLREETNELSDSKRTTHPIKPNSSKTQLFTFQTRENKHKGNSKSEKDKTIQQLWPLPDRIRDREDRGQRSIKREPFNASSEIKSNFPSTQLPDQDGQMVEKGSTEELENLEEKPEQRAERTSDIKRNSKEESGKKKRNSKEASKLIPFKADKNITIYIVRRRNSKGKTDISLRSKRSGTEIYRIKEMKLNQSKNREEILTSVPKITDSYFLGRSKKRFYQNRTFALGHSNKNIYALRVNHQIENTADSTTANNLHKIISKMSITSNELGINSSTAQAKENIVSKSSDYHPFNSILNVGNGPKTTRKPTGQAEIIAKKLDDGTSQFSAHKTKPKDNFEENTAYTTLSTDYLKTKTKTPSNVSRIKQRSKFFRHESVPETPMNSIDAEGESSAVFPYEEHSNDIEDEISFRSGSIYSANRRSLDRKNFIEKLNLKSRKNSIDSTSKLYQDRLLKLKQFLNRHSVLDNADESSIDFEGIYDCDLLLYPYAEIYENKTIITEVKRPNVSKGIKENSRPTPRPPDDQIKSEKPVSRNTACIICRTIRGNQGEKEAPFMEKMRKEQRRRELLAYRARMEEPCIKSCNFLPEDLNNKTGRINMHDLGKKELYSLESSITLFGNAKTSISL
ncbi:uncharacterized protein LOC6544735 [Drosophila erecta]|uniref:Uncharacterized protein n=1 Tax=Drosophila erecta TaxID=7220 RepID=B3NE59_DROER|nr:uncharacterized protein LOC6544735 [Drosophila erecta]EDV52483.2 uncharacterized protein Dere_GG16096 [Drosophila erecta]